MIQWYEGEVIAVHAPDAGDKIFTCDAHVLKDGFDVTGIQLPPINSFQQGKLQLHSKIMFYRDSSASAKFGFLISDPLPIGSPIAVETANQAAIDGEDIFFAGEVALSAAGSDEGIIPTEGAYLWLKNNGDAHISSGTGLQQVSVEDSTDSVNIVGNNVDIKAVGNFLLTHAFQISTNLLGATSSSWGLQNPVTGVFASSIGISSLGVINIGLSDPVLRTLLSGISYTSVPSLSALAPPQITLTAVPIISHFDIDTAHASLSSPVVSVRGATVTLSGVSPTAVVPAANINLVATNTNITGIVTISGSTSITGLLSVTNPVAFSLSGVVIAPPTPVMAAAGVTGQVPILVNGLPKFMLIAG